MRNRWPVSLEQVLVQAIFVSQAAQRRFKAAGECVDLGMIEAFVINSLHPQNHSKIAILRQERVLINERENIEESIERTRGLMLLPDLTDFARHHRTTSTRNCSRFPGSYCGLYFAELSRMRSI